MYFIAQSFGSFQPRLAISGLLGIQYSPPDLAVVPPTTGAFSINITDAPERIALVAVANPAPPPAGAPFPPGGGARPAASHLVPRVAPPAATPAAASSERRETRESSAQGR